MNRFVYIALVVVLSTVAVQGYGPKINRRRPGPPHGPPRQPQDWHGPHNGPPWGPNHHRHWDDSHSWGSGSDSSGSFGSSGPDGSSSPEDSFDFRPEKDSGNRFDSSGDDSGEWFDHRHTKGPCKHTTKPPKPTTKPTPQTPKPTPKTTKSPHPDPTRVTPTTGTTAPVTRPTTPQITLRPPTTVGPVPKTPVTTTEDTIHWETTTDSVPETTTDIEEPGFTTISPKMQQCIDSCLSTPEYNPVCGSNGQTYDNEGKLFCAAECGVNVTLRRRSVCPPPNWDDGDQTTGTDTAPPPTTTETPFVGRTTSLSDFQRCMKQCHISPSFTPVCGSDFITYMNKDRLQCAQRCGEVVEVICDKPCAACGIHPVTPKTTTTLRTTTTSPIGRSTLEPNIQECIKACPVTPEYNPVCGSNYVTYGNPGRLLCAQLCGVEVSVTRLGPCGSTTTTTSTTTTPAPPITRSPDVLRCIRSCPVTSEYDPVCGTDTLTYTNLGNLLCAKHCGVEVEFRHKSRCFDEFDLRPDGNDSTTSRTTKAIDDQKDPVTTASTSSLFTSPTTTTEKPTSPITTPTSTKTPGPSSSTTLGFTIPIDVLIDIFGSTTTQAPPTAKPTPHPDDDEDLDLDARFSNSKDTHHETDKDTHIEIDKESDKETHKEVDKKSDKENHKETDKETIKDTDEKSGKETAKQSDKEIDRGHYSKIIFPD